MLMNRSDPLKSTATAENTCLICIYFGDWELVLASYNSGPGNVSKSNQALRKETKLLGHQEASSKETQGYVPAATMYLYEYHNEHGIKADRAVVQHFATDDQKQMSFKQVADFEMFLLHSAITKSVVQIEYNSFYNDENHYLITDR
jgi:membrane-bound lytic murein transglycosylase D